MKKNINKIADKIRKDVIRVSVKNKAGHIAPSLSSVDIVTALYCGVMDYDFSDPLKSDRDRLIFSKAHGCYPVYALLADKGTIPKDQWKNFYTEKSTLHGCMQRNLEYGLEAGCGSLGHGLPIAAGIAYAAKLKNEKFFVYCVMGDGEMQEGTTWEALNFAIQYKLDNLVVIVDANGLQAMDFLKNILPTDRKSLIKRIKGFGIKPVVCDGHNAQKLSQKINNIKKNKKGIPHVFIANTIKGCGLKCMENIAKFHFRIPTQEELEA
ncbi:MAG: 1-deoxy-D-xylulose-5-phosphate synthase N-terminal domain-containing protein [Candidatus Omnitrophica bacterium]|nr:1-deoxy-D-xylulose-5-phosphate synthase N-terminal domain-containing protein [Candidatus Omnitrophota bacterium]MDD5441350.1 1-deoxy-D-xylulose-5-phosphate synthase N-terminal domain-containing protein [Candidatus Omnitrophota bacterium]